MRSGARDPSFVLFQRGLVLLRFGISFPGSLSAKSSILAIHCGVRTTRPGLGLVQCGLVLLRFGIGGIEGFSDSGCLKGVGKGTTFGFLEVIRVSCAVPVLPTMGLFKDETEKKQMLTLFLLLALLVPEAAGNVVLIGKNVSLSFPDVEANFGEHVVFFARFIQLCFMVSLFSYIFAIFFLCCTSSSTSKKIR